MVDNDMSFSASEEQMSVASGLRAYQLDHNISLSFSLAYSNLQYCSNVPKSYECTQALLQHYILKSCGQLQ
jgi:hypothetical protein